MPFNTTTTHPLTAAAKVTVEFKGLLLLKPDGNNGCEIGIHRFSSTHMFQVILIVRKPERAPTLVRLVTGPLTRPFAINVTPPPPAWAFRHLHPLRNRSIAAIPIGPITTLIFAGRSTCGHLIPTLISMTAPIRLRR